MTNQTTAGKVKAKLDRMMRIDAAIRRARDGADLIRVLAVIGAALIAAPLLNWLLP